MFQSETEEPIILSNTSHTHFTILPFVQRAVNQSTSGLLGFKSIPVILNFNNLHLTLILQDHQMFLGGMSLGWRSWAVIACVTQSSHATQLQLVRWRTQVFEFVYVWKNEKLRWPEPHNGWFVLSLLDGVFRVSRAEAVQDFLRHRTHGYFTDGKFKGCSFYIKTNIWAA